MRYKMQSLDSHSGIVGLIRPNYHLQHIMYKSRISQGHRPRSQLQALQAYTQLILLTWK